MEENLIVKGVLCTNKQKKDVNPGRKPQLKTYLAHYKQKTISTTIYHAEVTSERTNLSPFTKDYRGAAS